MSRTLSVVVLSLRTRGQHLPSLPAADRQATSSVHGQMIDGGPRRLRNGQVDVVLVEWFSSQFSATIAKCLCLTSWFHSRYEYPRIMPICFVDVVLVSDGTPMSRINP